MTLSVARRSSFLASISYSQGGGIRSRRKSSSFFTVTLHVYFWFNRTNKKLPHRLHSVDADSYRKARFLWHRNLFTFCGNLGTHFIHPRQPPRTFSGGKINNRGKDQPLAEAMAGGGFRIIISSFLCINQWRLRNIVSSVVSPYVFYGNISVAPLYRLQSPTWGDTDR